MDFTGQTVLVTGGGSGIGAAVARAFGSRGANVLLTYLSSEGGAEEIVQSIKARGGKAVAMKADLTQERDVVAATKAAIELNGRLDLVVANAGGLLERVKCVDTTEQFWRNAMSLNLDSVFLCCREALRHMLPAGSGRLILMSSLAGHDGGGPGATHYAAAKGALIAYTRALAKEVGPNGITVNAIAPGLIATRFHDQFNTPEGRAAAVSRTPLRREGQADDVAGAALYLASPLANFITGETIEVNGGLGLY